MGNPSNTSADSSRLDGPQSRSRAAEAAKDGDAWACVSAIVRGPALDGLVRRLRRYPHIDEHLAHDLFGDALEVLYAAIREGKEIRDPLAWLRRVAINKANDLEDIRQQNEVPLEDDPHFKPVEGDGVSRDILRDQALRICFSLVDRVQQATPRAVTKLILEAIREGRPDGMPQVEIAARLKMTPGAVHAARSRGLRALTELIEEEGHHLTLDFARRLEEDDQPTEPDPA